MEVECLLIICILGERTHRRYVRNYLNQLLINPIVRKCWTSIQIWDNRHSHKACCCYFLNACWGVFFFCIETWRMKQRSGASADASLDPCRESKLWQMTGLSMVLGLGQKCAKLMGIICIFASLAVVRMLLLYCSLYTPSCMKRRRKGTKPANGNLK